MSVATRHATNERPGSNVFKSSIQLDGALILDRDKGWEFFLVKKKYQATIAWQIILP